MQLSKEEVKKVVGANLRKYREDRNKSIEWVAFEAEMDYTQLSRIELGKINTSIYQLYKISKSLQISLNEIIQVLD